MSYESHLAWQLGNMSDENEAYIEWSHERGLEPGSDIADDAWDRWRERGIDYDPEDYEDEE